MALDPVVNFFQTEIATLPVASGGTSIVVSSGDGAKLPDPSVDGAFNLTIYNESDPFASPEIVRVTAITGDTLTVTRAQEGTSATTKTAGSDWYIELTPTAKTIQDIDTAKLDVADVVNNLTSTDTDKALSANQGKVLQDGKEPADATILKQVDVVDTLVSTLTTAPLSANQGKVLQDNKEPADATILKQANIVNNLTSTSTTAPLSANQGKVLQDGKLNLSGGTMTGDLTIPDKIIHSGDTNTAIRFPANDTVSVETNGSERMRITSAGNVGIGTTDTLGLLNVNGQVAIGSSNNFRTQIFSGGLPATGITLGLTKFVFNFTFSDTFGTALITLDLSAGLATTNFAKYIFAVKCSANSGTTATQDGSTNNVVQIGFSSFTFAATATTRTFTVTVTRSGSENWGVFGGFKIEAVTNVRSLTLNSVTAIP